MIIFVSFITVLTIAVCASTSCMDPAVTPSPSPQSGVHLYQNTEMIPNNSLINFPFLPCPESNMCSNNFINCNSTVLQCQNDSGDIGTWRSPSNILGTNILTFYFGQTTNSNVPCMCVNDYSLHAAEEGIYRCEITDTHRFIKQTLLVGIYGNSTDKIAVTERLISFTRDAHPPLFYISFTVENGTVTDINCTINGTNTTDFDVTQNVLSYTIPIKTSVVLTFHLRRGQYNCSISNAFSSAYINETIRDRLCELCVSSVLPSQCQELSSSLQTISISHTAPTALATTCSDSSLQSPLVAGISGILLLTNLLTVTALIGSCVCILRLKQNKLTLKNRAREDVTLTGSTSGHISTGTLYNTTTGSQNTSAAGGGGGDTTVNYSSDTYAFIDGEQQETDPHVPNQYETPLDLAHVQSVRGDTSLISAALPPAIYSTLDVTEDGHEYTAPAAAASAGYTYATVNKRQEGTAVSTEGYTYVTVDKTPSAATRGYTIVDKSKKDEDQEYSRLQHD